MIFTYHYVDNVILSLWQIGEIKVADNSLTLVLKSISNQIEMMERIISDYRERNAELEAQVVTLAKENKDLKKRIGDRCC